MNKIKAVCFNIDEKDQKEAYEKASKMQNFSLFVRLCVSELDEDDLIALSKKDLVKSRISNLKKKLTDKGLHRSTHHRIEKKIEQLEQGNEDN